MIFEPPWAWNNEADSETQVYNSQKAFLSAQGVWGGEQQDQAVLGQSSVVGYLTKKSFPSSLLEDKTLILIIVFQAVVFHMGPFPAPMRSLKWSKSIFLENCLDLFTGRLDLFKKPPQPSCIFCGGWLLFVEPCGIFSCYHTGPAHSRVDSVFCA